MVILPLKTFGLTLMKKLPILLSLCMVVSACRKGPADLLDVGVPLEMARFRQGQLSGVVYGLSLEIPR